MLRAAAVLALQLAALGRPAQAAKASKAVDWPEDVSLLEAQHNCWSTNGTRIDLTKSLPGLRTEPPTVAACAEAALANPGCGAAVELRRPDSTVRFCGCGRADSTNVVCQQEPEGRRKMNNSDIYALHGVHHRSAERVAAGKRAAEHVACLVCEAQVVSAWPTRQDPEEVFESGALVDELSAVKDLCRMKHIATILRMLRLEVKGMDDGTATLERLPEGSTPFYTEDDEAMVGPLFHWKSFAVRHACAEIFRKDAEALAEAFAEAWWTLDDEVADSDDPGGSRTFLASKAACKKASRMCRAANKKLEKVGRTSAPLVDPLRKMPPSMPPASAGEGSGPGEEPLKAQEEL